MKHDDQCIPNDAYNACRFHSRQNFPQLHSCEALTDTGDECIGFAEGIYPLYDGSGRDIVLCAQHLATFDFSA